MNKGILFSLLSISLNLFCQSPQYSADFKIITESESCKLLIDSVAKSWKPVHDGEYYKSLFTPKKTESRSVSFPCITSIKRPDVNILFGQPNKKELNTDFYYTSEPHKNYLTNSLLKITYFQSRLTGIQEISCPGTDKFVRRNFKYDEKRNLYKSPLIPKFFGVDTINNECLKALSSSEFISVLGKPTLKFGSEMIMAMQKIEWDEKGNEVQKPILDNKITWLRYLTDTTGVNKNNGFEVKVHPDHAYTTLIAYNCNHAQDTVAKKWKFNPDKKYFECKLNWMQLDLISKCLYGLSKSEILSLFGSPSKQTASSLEYYLQTFPAERVAEPERIVISFDKVNRLVTLIQESGLYIYSSH